MKRGVTPSQLEAMLKIDRRAPPAAHSATYVVLQESQWERVEVSADVFLTSHPLSAVRSEQEFIELTASGLVKSEPQLLRHPERLAVRVGLQLFLQAKVLNECGGQRTLIFSDFFTIRETSNLGVGSGRASRSAPYSRGKKKEEVRFYMEDLLNSAQHDTPVFLLKDLIDAHPDPLQMLDGLKEDGSELAHHLVRLGKYLNERYLQNCRIVITDGKVDVLRANSNPIDFSAYARETAYRQLNALIRQFPHYLRPKDYYDAIIECEPDPQIYGSGAEPDAIPLQNKKSQDKILRTLSAVTLFQILKRARLLYDGKVQILQLNGNINLIGEPCRDAEGRESCSPHALTLIEQPAAAKQLFDLYRLINEMPWDDRQLLSELLLLPLRRDEAVSPKLKISETIPPLVKKAANHLFTLGAILRERNIISPELFTGQKNYTPPAEELDLQEYYRNRLLRLASLETKRNPYRIRGKVDLTLFPKEGPLRDLLTKQLKENDKLYFENIPWHKTPPSRNYPSTLQALAAMGLQRMNHHDAQQAHCLYVSIIQAVGGIRTGYTMRRPLGRDESALIKNLREGVARYIETNLDAFLPYVLESDESKGWCTSRTLQGKKKALFAKAKAIRGTQWASDIEVGIISQILGRRIELYDLDQRNITGEPKPISVMGDHFSGEPLRLGFINRNHFNWLMPGSPK